MKLRNFILITTNLVAITTFSTVSCGKQVEKPIDPAETVAKAFKTTYASVLNKTEDNVTLDDEAQVTQALSTYNNLDTNAKTKLSSKKELLDKLDAKIKQLKAENSGRNNTEPNPPVQDPARDNGNHNQNTGTGNGTEQTGPDIKPKDPNNTQEDPKEENVPSNPGTSDPAPTDPTKEPTNGNQESPKTEPNPTPTPKDPVTEEPGNGGKQPNEENPNNGADNGSNLEDPKDPNNSQPGDNKEQNQNQTPSDKPNPPSDEAVPGDSENSQNTGTGNGSEQPRDSAEQKTPNSETPQENSNIEETKDSKNKEEKNTTDTQNNETTQNPVKSDTDESQIPPTEPKKELQEQQMKITNLVVYRDTYYRDYLFFVLTVTKDLWLKLEKSNFKIAIEPESNRSKVYDDTTSLNPKEKLNENGGNVTFRIFLDYPGLREGSLLTPGNWIITQLSDTNEPGYNLLNKEYKFAIDQNKNIKMINN